jgi:hypothetical protein
MILGSSKEILEINRRLEWVEYYLRVHSRVLQNIDHKTYDQARLSISEEMLKDQIKKRI